MARKNFSRKERVRLFDLHGGKCHLCGEKIQVGEKWELEHLIPWELTRDDSDENVRPAHPSCHKPKTVKDTQEIRKADRIRAVHIGAKKSKNPLPGGRNSKWKKKISGEVVLR